MTRLLLWIVTGLLLALAVHVATLFSIPYLAMKAPKAGLRPLAPDFVFANAPVDLLPRADPALRTALCHFDLAQGPARIRAQTTDGFTSLAVYTDRGLHQYALNDRAATRGVIEFTLYTAAQLADVRAREGPDTPESLRVLAAEERGIVAVRALVLQASQEPDVLAALSQATCSPVPR